MKLLDKLIRLDLFILVRVESESKTDADIVVRTPFVTEAIISMHLYGLKTPVKSHTLFLAEVTVLYLKQK